MTKDEIARLLAVRDSLILDDTAEAYHHLYQLADAGRFSFTPWDEWEIAVPETERLEVG
jgi:hypothetical protein